MDTCNAVYFVARAKSSWLRARSWLSPRASGIQQCAFLLTMSPRLINARHATGLPTRISTSKIADHSNAVAENAVNRIRGLACTLMEEVQAKIGMKLNTNDTIWSWASWLLNRYVVQPLTSRSTASHTVASWESLVSPSTPS